MSYRLWIFFDPCTTLLDSIGKFSISTCPTERRKTEREEKEAAVKTENLGGGGWRFWSQITKTGKKHGLLYLSLF
jgi:hypothetical protein